jgi:hypothetical protein
MYTGCPQRINDSMTVTHMFLLLSCCSTLNACAGAPMLLPARHPTRQHSHPARAILNAENQPTSVTCSAPLAFMAGHVAYALKVLA